MGLRQNFVKNLKFLRKFEGLSQAKLAEKCGTDASYIGQIEIGLRFPSLELIEKIAQALSVEPYRLFMVEMEPFYEGSSEITRFLAQMPLQIRLNLVEHINSALNDCVKQSLTP
ncbi:MAG: helix-turn-helix domain-containing protein [Spirochaetaceae bacterium]|jgi:transcriptional regulator with XRE-family HTH domain|nr:helix-turn-helix domain-containing protein [Spirochaetaceae bacterium]